MRILHIEPFFSGSHASFASVLEEGVDAEWTLLTLPGRHWKWRARGSAPFFAVQHGPILELDFDLLLAGSFVSLAELIGLQPQLARIPRVLYFHENQLTYPVQEEHSRERDFHFGFSQLVSALAATHCVFNSEHNRRSFLSAGRSLLERMPDAVPKGWIESIEDKSSVLPVPLDLPVPPTEAFRDPPASERSAGPIILWNHRWEHDKAPEVFFAALERLQQGGVPFRLAVCGERFQMVPESMVRAQRLFASRIIHWGFLESRSDYETLLARSHLAVSTARHEFFGIAILEATHFGARPVAPNALAYPELLPEPFLYENEDDLGQTLARLCLAWTNGELDLKADRRSLTRPYGAATLDRYAAFFEEVTASR